MTFIKRGLGRGLEALLTDITNKTDIEQAPAASNDMNDELVVAHELIDNFQTENQVILSEAEQAKALLEELEAIIRDNLE